MEAYGYFNDISEAQEALREVERIIDDEGLFTMSKFKEILGLDPNADDDEFGWYDIDEARVMKSISGYYTIAMPDYEYLK